MREMAGIACVLSRAVQVPEKHRQADRKRDLSGFDMLFFANALVSFVQRSIAEGDHG